MATNAQSIFWLITGKQTRSIFNAICKQIIAFDFPHLFCVPEFIYANWLNMIDNVRSDNVFDCKKNSVDVAAKQRAAHFFFFFSDQS